MPGNYGMQKLTCVLTTGFNESQINLSATLPKISLNFKMTIGTMTERSLKIITCLDF